MDMRSKARTFPGPVNDPSKLPKWNYDGSSTNQAPGEDSEVILYPQAIFKDPFRGGNNILVMCDAYTPGGQPIPTNKRCAAAKIFSHPNVVVEEPWYGLEQEYTLLQKDVKWPLGWPVGGFPGPQGPYYCGAGADKAFGRDIVDAHYKACLYAGINVSGINGEVMPGQWEFQVGPSVGISASDELWVARYILERITEIAGVVLSFDPKPIQGDWNGAGAHTNYSTKTMRNEGGYEIIKKAIEKLGLRHKEHIAAYGEGNERRLTGRHETADINTFKWGVANRGASIRVGRDTEKDGKGYFALIAMVGKNCFAIASDRRLGVQLQTIATDFQKIYKVHDKLFLGLSGLATDAQTLYQRLVFRHKLYQLREERDMKPETFANLVSSILYEKRFGPYFCQPVIAGLGDEDKPFICTMDSIGAKELAKDFVVAGTASESLYGACESMFKPDMEPEELFETISQALLSSVDRDCLSGWGGHVYVVTSTEIRERILKGRMD